MKSFLIALTTVLGLAQAHAAEDAGLFIEPAVTYETSDFDVNYPFTDSQGETNGFGLGARLGFHVSDVLFVGVDGRYSKLNFEDSNSSFNYDTDADQFNVAPVVGIQMPVIGLRVWGSYVLTSTLDPKEASGIDMKFKDGKGYRIGAGFRVLAVSLNLEYQKIKYDETDVQQLPGPIPAFATDDVKLDNEAWIASISFPISI